MLFQFSHLFTATLLISQLVRHIGSYSVIHMFFPSDVNCVESVQIRSLFWSVFGHFSHSGFSLMRTQERMLYRGDFYFNLETEDKNLHRGKLYALIRTYAQPIDTWTILEKNGFNFANFISLYFQLSHLLFKIAYLRLWSYPYNV